MKPSTKKKKRDRLALFSKLNVVLLHGVLVAGTWLAERTSITTAIAYSPQFPWLLPAVVLIVVCAIKKRAALAFINTAVLGIYAWLLLGFTVPNLKTETEGQKFSLLTFNIKHAPEGWNTVQDLIAKRKPYIFCLQEANGPRKFMQEIASVPGYHVVQFGDLAIGCKDALTNVHPVPLVAGYQPAFTATAGNGVKVVAVHLPAYALERVGRRNVFEIPAHMQSIGAIHERQAERLVELYGKEPDCVIVGDFNGPPRGHAYTELTSVFTDTFAHKGFGFGYTFPSGLPVIRIDYAFLTDIKPIHAEVIATTISDHRPVMFDMLLYRPT